MQRARDSTREVDDSDCVLSVIRELDNLLSALRLLVRTCEKRKFHNQTHMLELIVEILLRRRNYILNASTADYSSFPCDNCYITYPTVFLMSWLDYLLRTAPDILYAGDENDMKKAIYAPPDSSLCRRSCSQYFTTTFSRADHMTEGALYPLGAPFVPGPTDGPPAAATAQTNNVTMLGESDELDSSCKAVEYVLNTLRVCSSCNSTDVDLAQSVFDSLYCRKDFGFDMDCVNSPEVQKCRLQLYDSLLSYNSRVLAESLNLSQ